MGIERKFSLKDLKRLPLADCIDQADVVTDIANHLLGYLNDVQREQDSFSMEDVLSAWRAYDGDPVEVPPTREAPLASTGYFIPGPRAPKGYHAFLVDEPYLRSDRQGYHGAFLLKALDPELQVEKHALPLLRLEYVSSNHRTEDE